MTYDDYTAGVDLWRATGSLIARPQRVVPRPLIVIPPLWPTPYDLVLPDGPIDVRRTDGRGTPVFPDAPWEIPAPEWAVLDMIEQRWDETVWQFGKTWFNRPPDVGQGLTLRDIEQAYADAQASGPAPPIPERYVGSRIRFSYPSSEMDAAAHRFEMAMAALFSDVPQLHEHTPPDEDLVATLLDFARAGDESAFRDLALMRGVPAGEIADMWAGTLKRVGKKA